MKRWLKLKDFSPSLSVYLEKFHFIKKLEKKIRVFYFSDACKSELVANSMKYSCM